MKVFLLSIIILGGVFFFLKNSNSSNGIGGHYASAKGLPLEVTPENSNYTITHNDAPVIAYFWASW